MILQINLKKITIQKKISDTKPLLKIFFIEIKKLN